MGKFRFKSVIRLGSTTEVPKDNIEINTIEAVRNSSNKRTMKRLFDENGVRTATWWENISDISEDSLPIVAKHNYGSRGRGNYLIQNQDELDNFRNRENTGEFIFEKYHTHAREYRLHVTKNGCFYTCRKMIRRDTPEDQKWFRNDNNCVWILEENPEFNKPNNWQDMVNESIKALNTTGLDIGAVDLKVSTGTDDDNNHDYFVVEVNSAPSFGDLTVEKYKEVLPKLLKEKFN